MAEAKEWRITDISNREDNLKTNMESTVATFRKSDCLTGNEEPL